MSICNEIIMRCPAANNEWRLREPFQENIRLVLQGGADLFIDFTLRFEPNNKDTIRLFIQAENEDALFAVSSGVEQALNAVIAYYDKWEIAVRGFDVHVINNRFHPIDSRINGYRMLTCRTFYQAIQKGLFDPFIVHSNCNSALFECYKLREDRTSKDMNNTVYLPVFKSYDQNLILSRDCKLHTWVDPIGKDVSKIDFEIEIYNKTSDRRPNRVAIAFDDTVRVWAANTVVQAVQNFLRTTEKRGLNPGGFEMYVQLIEPSMELKESPALYMNSLEWALQHVFAKNEK